MAGVKIGYARCSTGEQDLTAQRLALVDLGVDEKRIYLDRGLSGTNRKRPGLDQALAAVRKGDTLVVPKLDRLARSVPDARDIGDSLAERGVLLALGRCVCVRGRSNGTFGRELKRQKYERCVRGRIDDEIGMEDRLALRRVFA